MLTIKAPRVTNHNGKARLSADIVLDGTVYPLWFEVEAKYGDYLCAERSDAFVLAVLYWCMMYGHDIRCEAPMTDRLYRQLTDQFLLPFYKLNGMSRDEEWTASGRGYSVRIESPVASEVMHPTGGDLIGTGISCGVDSLHVFATHSDVSCACIWHAHVTTGIASMDSEAGQLQAWNGMRSRAESFARDAGVPLLIGDTNFDRSSLPGLQWDGMTTYGNLFCIFATQKLWARYYIASDCDIMDFHLRFPSLRSDPARYEYFLFPHLSLSHLSILMDGQHHNRVEKVRDLVDYPHAQRYLNVCHRVNEGHRNGTHDCPKCMRTLLDLEAVGAVDKFSEVFDIVYFRKNFHEFLAEYYRGVIQKDNFALELVPYYKSRRYPLFTRLKAWKIVLRKAFLKALRLGRTSHSFSSK